jgi:fibronectin-binding autotransporter adhesin
MRGASPKKSHKRDVVRVERAVIDWRTNPIKHMKKILFQLRTLTAFTAVFTVVQFADAQSMWGGGGADQNWSTSGNWSAGGVPSSDTVTFPAGAFPITTNVQGAVNNIINTSTAITSLTYANAAGTFNTTLIPTGITLTDSGSVIDGGAAIPTVTTISGGGTLIGGTSGTATLTASSSSGIAILDLSSLSNFVFNSGGAGGPVNIGNSGGGGGSMNLAAISNNITSTTYEVADNNTACLGTNNLGNGTNIINANTINIGIDKATGVMQFINNAGGGLTIASATGTGRATITLGGTASSGGTGTSDNGSMLFNGGTVNILAGTMTLGSRAARSETAGSANGVLSFNRGTVDVTTINMGINSSTGSTGNGTISVGSSGRLIIGTGGLSLVNNAGTIAALVNTGTLIITNGGSVICSNSIYKTTSKGTGTVTMSGGSLNLANIAGTMGVSNSIPIDNFNLTNSTLTLPVAASSANVVVTSFNPDTATTSTININFMPSITTYPSLIPVVTYTTGGGNLGTGGILPNIVLGTLPNTFGTYSGYVSNDTATLTLWLVVTNGPSVSTVEWGGGVNNRWDTTSLNWTNNGAAVKYNDGDFVTFDDLGQTGNVNLTRTNQPATLTFNNSVLDYNLSGIGCISGPVSLVMNGTATNTLAETGGDNFSLGIAVNDGTLVLDETNSTISGGLVIASGATVQIGNNDANGTLPSGGLDDEGTLVYDRTNNVTVATDIPGGGALTQNGSGKLTLSVSNGYAGNTTVNNGTLALTGSGSIASSTQVTVNSNAMLDVSGVTAATTTLTSLTLSNASLNMKVGYLQTNLTMTSLTMSGTTNIINVISLPAIAYYPATNTLLQTSGGITGYNFGLGSLPAGSVGTIAESGDGNSVLLTLTSGPIGVRPSVTWSGVDALGNVNTNWSDAQNWVTPGVPVAAEPVFFTGTATAGASPFDLSGGVGSSGSVDAANINNIVDASFTNAALNYANGSGTFHNTQIASGKTLTVNGSLTVNGGGGTVTILGTGAALKVNNPNNTSTFNVENGTAPTLDMSGLDTFTATVNQIGIGYDISSSGSEVNGIWYLARTNIITTGVGSFSTGTAWIVGGATATTAGTGQVYLGQTNALYVDGILLGLGGANTGSLITFNPAFTNPIAYIRGISGSSSRVTLWSLGDDTVNLNNGGNAYGQINDFSAGTLNALVGTLLVGQGAQGNGANAHTPNAQVSGTFNMGAGNLDVTTLKIGVGGSGVEGGGIGIMNVSNGTVVVGSLSLSTGGLTNTAGTLNLSAGATLTVNSGVTVGAATSGTVGGTLSVVTSTVSIFNNGTIGTPSAPLMTLNLDGATVQLGVNGNNAVGNANLADIVATTVTTNSPTTINIGSVANVNSTVQIPLISYTGTDPYGALSLGTYPAGYNATLVDDAANSSVDLSIASLVNTTRTNIVAIVSGNQLHLSWPADHTGWQLQVQTNSLNTGLSSNWFTLPGSTTVNSTNITINPANGAVFFRLYYP